MPSALASIAKQLLLSLLRAYSPTGREELAVGVLKKCAHILGYQDVYVDRVGNLVACFGRGERALALVGHVDTVSGELPLVVEGNVVRGRGAVDAKGPLLAALLGASETRGFVDSSKWRICVIACVGEEGDSRGAKELVSSGFEAEAIVVVEPSNTYSVVVGYRGSLKVEISCWSRGGHSSSPPSEKSACEKLLSLWSMIKSSYGDFSARGNSSTLLNLTCGDPVAQSVYPREGRMVVDIRVSIDGRTTELLERLVEAVEGELPGCNVRIVDLTEPVKVSPNTPIVRSVVRSIIELGAKPRLVYKLGTSDMNVLYNLSRGNIVAYGPGRSELAHSEREAISLDELLFGANVYRGTIINYVN